MGKVGSYLPGEVCGRGVVGGGAGLVKALGDDLIRFWAISGKGGWSSKQEARLPT